MRARFVVRGLLVAALCLVCLPRPAAALGVRTKLVPIPLKLPKPGFIGTPKKIKPRPTLEKWNDKPRPPFLAPKGAKNVARDKEVTSSDDSPYTGDFEQITDGDKECGDGSYVELGPGRQYVQIDLGANHSIYAIVVWHAHGQPCVYHDVVVQVASDPDFITEVRTLYSNDHDNSSGLGIGRHLEYIESNKGRLVDAKGTVARYVRLYSKGNTDGDTNRYTEIEVYGLPAK